MKDHGDGGDGSNSVLNAGPPPYDAIATPPPPGIGALLLSLAEPSIGHERAYNRWYEDDHFPIVAGGAPFVTAARRWVATRALRDLRRPGPGGLLEPPGDGCYLTTLWIARERAGDYREWVSAMLPRLVAGGRGFAERRLPLGALVAFAGAAGRDDEPASAPHALDYPHAGLVLEIVDAADGDGTALARRLIGTHLPARIAAGTARLCACFSGDPAAAGTPLPPGLAAEGGGRLYLLWFCVRPPEEIWGDFADEESRLLDQGGVLRLLAPFVPTMPGTDEYVDLLR